MSSRIRSIPLVIVGVIALIIGGVFAGQGANVIHGSAMSGESMWLYIGILVAAGGIILIVLGVRRPGRSNKDS